MPFTITCPACQTTSPCPDQFAGRKVKCKKCSQGFLANKPGSDLDDADIIDDVEFVDDAEVVEETPAPKPKPKPPLPQREAPKPVKKKPIARGDEDDEDDDEDDDEPRPKSKKRRAPEPATVGPMVYAMMAVVGLVLLGGGSTLAYFAIKNDRKEPTKTAEVPPPPGTTPKNQGMPGPGVPQVPNVPTDNWVEIHDEERNFRIKFPTNPTKKTETLPGGTQKTNIYVAAIPALQEQYLAFALPLTPQEMGLASDQLFDVALAGFGQGFAGKATERARRSFLYQGYNVRELEMVGNGTTAVIRLIHASNRMFFVTAAAQGPTVTDKMKAFLATLKIE